MATYKVLQDIEAEDKLVGPFTLWQFIYLFVAGLCGYLGFLAVAKNVPVFLILLLPVALFAGFLAIPWGSDQPTEVWALAKLRFFLKPRIRIWNQDGMTELVSITAPKIIERQLTNGLNQHQVHSRLNALASTLDSRGWAVKNINVSLSAMQTAPEAQTSDRLVDVASMPQEVLPVDVRPGDDILDETANTVAHNFDAMIDERTTEKRQKLVDFMNNPMPQPTGAGATSAPLPPAAAQPAPESPQTAQWFAPPAASAAPFAAPVAPPPATQPLTGMAIPQAVEPTAAEEALAARLKTENEQQDIAYTHLQTIKTPEEVAAEAAEQAAMAAQSTIAAAPASSMTPEKQAAIINLSRDNNQSIASLEKEAEVVISLH